MKFCFTVLQLFTHVLEITAQEIYMGICRGDLLTYLLTYLFNLSQHYDGDVEVMCNSLLAYF